MRKLWRRFGSFSVAFALVFVGGFAPQTVHTEEKTLFPMLSSCSLVLGGDLILDDNYDPKIVLPYGFAWNKIVGQKYLETLSLGDSLTYGVNLQIRNKYDSCGSFLQSTLIETSSENLKTILNPSTRHIIKPGLYVNLTKINFTDHGETYDVNFYDDETFKFIGSISDVTSIEPITRDVSLITDLKTNNLRLFDISRSMFLTNKMIKPWFYGYNDRFFATNTFIFDLTTKKEIADITELTLFSPPKVKEGFFDFYDDQQRNHFVRLDLDEKVIINKVFNFTDELVVDSNEGYLASISNKCFFLTRIENGNRPFTFMERKWPSEVWLNNEKAFYQDGERMIIVDLKDLRIEKQYHFPEAVDVIKEDENLMVLFPASNEYFEAYLLDSNLKIQLWSKTQIDRFYDTHFLSAGRVVSIRTSKTHEANEFEKPNIIITEIGSALPVKNFTTSFALPCKASFSYPYLYLSSSPQALEIISVENGTQRTIEFKDIQTSGDCKFIESKKNKVACVFLTT